MKQRTVAPEYEAIDRLYGEGIMKQIASLGCNVSTMGMDMFMKEVMPKRKAYTAETGNQYSMYMMIADAFCLGYLEGIKADRKRKKNHSKRGEWVGC